MKKIKKVLVNKKVKETKLARKNFFKTSGVPFDMRVRNLNSGETEW